MQHNKFKLISGKQAKIHIIVMLFILKKFITARLT